MIASSSAVNTREGRVLAKLLERLLEIRSELGTDQVFDVVGEVFPANLLEKLFREMYVRRMDLNNIEARIVRDVMWKFAPAWCCLPSIADLRSASHLGKDSNERSAHISPSRNQYLKIFGDDDLRRPLPTADAVRGNSKYLQQ
jgi:hypothetical protein